MGSSIENSIKATSTQMGSNVGAEIGKQITKKMGMGGLNEGLQKMNQKAVTWDPNKGQAFVKEALKLTGKTDSSEIVGDFSTKHQFADALKNLNRATFKDDKSYETAMAQVEKIRSAGNDVDFRTALNTFNEQLKNSAKDAFDTEGEIKEALKGNEIKTPTTGTGGVHINMDRNSVTIPKAGGGSVEIDIKTGQKTEAEFKAILEKQSITGSAQDEAINNLKKENAAFFKST